MASSQHDWRTDTTKGRESAMADGLAIIDGYRRELAECRTVGDTMNVRAKLRAAAEFVRSTQKLTVEQRNALVVAELEVERLAGELLMVGTGLGSIGGDRKSSNAVLLDSVGVTKIESSRWQSLAAIPEDDFRDAIERSRQSGGVISKTAIIQMGAALKRAFRDDAQDTSDDCRVIDDLALLAGEKFGTVYADPPWRYGNQATRAATDDHYGTMSVADLCEMPVAELVADDAHLHLWTTNGFLRQAFELIDAWGFEYRSTFVWVKPQMGIGNYWRVSHEFLLLGIRGDAKRFATRNEMSWRSVKRGRHSAKPAEFRQMVERNSPGPYLELFGRTTEPGWVVYGNQVAPSLFHAAV
jgi:N6-adenosine-specific RNA methylase IME4